MRSGIGYLLFGIFLDATSLYLNFMKISNILSFILGIISIIFIVLGALKLKKYDKIREIGRKALEDKKK